MRISVPWKTIHILKQVPLYRGYIWVRTCLTHCVGRSNTIWWYRSGSTLAQVMACCLMAPSHYLNQCWLNINWIPHHSFQRYVYLNAEDTNPNVMFKMYTFEITATSSRGLWVITIENQTVIDPVSAFFLCRVMLLSLSVMYRFEHRISIGI